MGQLKPKLYRDEGGMGQLKTKLYRDEGGTGQPDNDFRLSIYTNGELGMDENLNSFVAATMHLFFLNLQKMSLMSWEGGTPKTR